MPRLLALITHIWLFSGFRPHPSSYCPGAGLGLLLDEPGYLILGVPHRPYPPKPSSIAVTFNDIVSRRIRAREATKTKLYSPGPAKGGPTGDWKPRGNPGLFCNHPRLFTFPPAADQAAAGQLLELEAWPSVFQMPAYTKTC